MIIDHIGITVSNTTQSKAFYTACLSSLDIQLLFEVEGWIGYGRAGKAEFWFGEQGQPQRSMHIAFAAATRQQVDNFYHSALAAGGKDNGAPGIREMYHPDYYGAFVLDPDGHNIEAVCHAPE